MDELARALELDRRVAVRGGREAIEIAEGWVIRSDDLPNVYSLNMLVLSGPLLPERFDAAALTALADRWLGHLSHRFVRLDDPDAAQRVWPQLERAGWRRSRTVFMALRTDPGGAIHDARAQEIPEPELDLITRANFEQHDYGPGSSMAVVRQLVAAQRAMREATTSRAFAAGEGGGLQSMCTLFLDTDVGGVRAAMVEEVGTLPSHRGRGLATAVVSAAIRSAGAWGAELVIVPADADDWPQLLYGKLGFEPIGIRSSFTLRRAATERRACETPR
jgi:GNAT superfamily N-acetyltransferase